jgi:acetylornithine/succinyldiaminopimelate/putrescine aminotransferase
MSAEKDIIYDTAARVWNPGKVKVFRETGIDIVFGEREGYTFKDIDGRRLINMHLNGGVFNLGHRNPEVKKALIECAELYDAGNHYFPSAVKNKFCESLLAVSPPYMKYVSMNNGGGESIDAAVKFARFATKRRRVVSVHGGFHGATGISMEAGSPEMASFFNMAPDPELYTQVDFDNLEQLEAALKKNDTACVLVESLPATFGFPIPKDAYLKGVGDLAHKYGALYVADEVQAGLMRSGSMWCAVGYGAEPDMIVTGKGLSGGYYPMSAVIMNERAASWMRADGFAHLSSFNSCELGCAVATKVVEITSRPETKANVDMLAGVYARGLADIQAKHPKFFVGIRQRGVIMGLKTAHPEGSTALMGALYKNGVWAMRANFDQSVLQFKAGLLMEKSLAEESLRILDVSMGQAATMLGFE